MARGKLVDTTDLPIVETDKEEGTIPFFMIEDDYGIACDQYNYMLCKRKQATRVIKDEENKPHHVETYYSWVSFKYTNTFKSIMYSYIDVKGKELNKRLIKQTNYEKIIENQNEIKSIIKKCFVTDGVNKDFVSFCDLVDKKTKIENELKSLENCKNELQKEFDSLMDLIKEKRKIIIKETK